VEHESASEPEVVYLAVVEVLFIEMVSASSASWGGSFA
jgi:hypothetical protein